MEKKACNQVLVRRQSLKANTISENEIAISSLPLELLQDDEAGVAARKAGGLPAACVKGRRRPRRPMSSKRRSLVHCKLVDYNLSGALPLLEDKPDMPPPFHLVCACAATSAPSATRSLARGSRATSCCPACASSGRRARRARVGSSPSPTARASIDATAARDGECPRRCGGRRGERPSGCRQPFTRPSAPPSQQTELALGGCAAHQLYERLAELQLAAGDEAKAGESAAAAEAAMEAGKARRR